MGRKNKEDEWFPADPLRIRAFARSLVPDSQEVKLGQEPKTSDIQKVLSQLAHPVDRSDQTIRDWVIGKTRPCHESVNWIKQGMPECADWLEPDIESSPIRRFLCALDVWGAPIDSPARKLDTASPKITVGMGVANLAKRWAPMPISAGGSDFSGFVIPRLKCHAPQQIPSTVYQAGNPLALMDFMFRSGSVLEFSEEEFTEWAVDLASLTLFVRAFLEGTSLAEQLQSGIAGDYSSLAYRIFFREHGNWPNVESVHWALQDFSEFDDSAEYSQRLMDARGVLRGNLLSIGSNLSIAEEIFGDIKDRNRMWQEPFGAHGETFDPSDLIRVKRNIAPAAFGRYRYELRTLNGGERVALCHDSENGTQAPLPERPDLFKGYSGSFGWGYSGSGPTFLAISILAHHLGHSDFGGEEIDRLLEKYIARFPEQFVETSFFLTTDLIDKCLNE